MAGKNIFNIQSNYNFLESLVFWILSQYPDPFYLSNITILLPSRRSCREIKKIFLKQAKSEAIILPKIKAIGDVDYDDLRLDLSLADTQNLQQTHANQEMLNFINKPTSPLKYHLLLCDEIKRWNSKTNLFGKNITIDQISAIAANLESFLQEVEKEKLDLDQLDIADIDEFAYHKQQILKFLRHFGSNWQNVLAKNNITSIMDYRNQMIEFNADYLRDHSWQYPIIMAGSTGSIKAVAKLIKAVLGLKNGFIVLSGLDKNLEEEAWKIIQGHHPQFMLKSLLDFLKLSRDEVTKIEFKQFKQSDDQIIKLASYAMLPSVKTADWQKIKDLDKKSVAHISKIEAVNNFEEAEVISLAIRKGLEEKGKNIALITNCRDLALMVKTQLKKWDINIDDSKNNSLNNCQIVNYLLNISELFENDFKSVNLLAILKHPVSRAGFAEKAYKQNLQLFELEILRSISSNTRFSSLRSKIIQNNNKELKDWFDKIYSALLPLIELFELKNNNLEKLLSTNISCAEELSKDQYNQINLYNQEGSEEFLEFAEELLNETDYFTVESQSYSKLLGQLMLGYNFVKKDNFHPRLHILSTMEARLINYDLIIVSGLNYGDFPAGLSGDNWLGRKIRADFGLPDLEQKIGVAAYDFCNYLGNKEVIITRSFNKNNSPTFKSPFLLKLEAVLQVTDLSDQLNKGLYYQQLLHLSSAINSRELISAPKPCPPLKYRPKKFSATDIGKWVRDPYYIYAKRVLKLKKLKQTDQEPSFAEFGNFVHLALENFVKDYQKIAAEERLNKLLNKYGKEAFKKYFCDEENKLLWWPKFVNIARWFVKTKSETDKETKLILTEVKVEAQINDTAITVIIDRIDIDSANNIKIIDYKTGIIAANSKVKEGLEPQLPLSAVILTIGEVKNYQELSEKINLSQIKDLQYFELKGKDKNNIRSFAQTKELNIEMLNKAAYDGIIKLITIFNNQDMPYASCPNPDIYNKKNDYHHLARIDEWQ